MEVNLIKLPGGLLRPANDSDAEKLEGVKNGAWMKAEIVQPRNPAFHRKWWAMINFGFGYWEPEPLAVGGIEPEKNLDRFRKDVLILAGFRKLVINIKGESRYEAESISFGSMDELRFNEVYKATFNVLWRMVLSKVQGMTEQEAHNAINAMGEFAG